MKLQISFYLAQMIEAIISGFLLGVILMLSVGPAFFAVIDTSINKGFKTALFFIIGVSVSDISYIVLSNIGATELLTQKIRAVYFVGGIGLALIGIYMFSKKRKDEVEHIEIKKGDLIKSFGKGWLINTTAPGVILFWTAAAIHLANEGYTIKQKFLFFTTSILVVVSADIGKAFTAQKLKERWLNHHVIHWINKLSGVGMFIFGCFMLYKGFKSN
jgi:threonine/homoserine/homoserine lactone efflux protein